MTIAVCNPCRVMNKGILCILIHISSQHAFNALSRSRFSSILLAALYGCFVQCQKVVFVSFSCRPSFSLNPQEYSELESAYSLVQIRISPSVTDVMSSLAVCNSKLNIHISVYI